MNRTVASGSLVEEGYFFIMIVMTETLSINCDSKEKTRKTSYSKGDPCKITRTTTPPDGTGLM